MVQCFVEKSCLLSDDIISVVLWLVNLIVIGKHHVAVSVHKIVDLTISPACWSVTAPCNAYY